MGRGWGPLPQHACVAGGGWCAVVGDVTLDVSCGASVGRPAKGAWVLTEILLLLALFPLPPFPPLSLPSLLSTTYEPAQKFPNLIFLKELSFRTSDTKHAARVVQVRGGGLKLAPDVCASHRAGVQPHHCCTVQQHTRLAPTLATCTHRCPPGTTPVGHAAPPPHPQTHKQTCLPPIPPTPTNTHCVRRRSRCCAAQCCSGTRSGRSVQHWWHRRSWSAARWVGNLGFFLGRGDRVCIDAKQHAHECQDSHTSTVMCCAAAASSLLMNRGLTRVLWLCCCFHDAPPSLPPAACVPAP